jgi:hypothetical protein
MDRFFSQENIKRYRKLRKAGTEENQRALILKQLAEEEAKFREQLGMYLSASSGRKRLADISVGPIYL